MSSKTKKIKLSEEEKDYISRIANTTGLDEKIVKQVFLSLLTCITLDMYSGKKEFTVPFFIKGGLKIKKRLIPEQAKFEFVEEYDIKTLEGFHTICTRFESGQSVWIESFLKSEIAKELNRKLSKS